MTCGPWKPISIEIYQARIADFSIQTRLNKDMTNVELDISVSIEGQAKHAQVEIQRDGVNVVSGALEIHDSEGTTTLALKDPELWWPFTLGDQPLYTASVILLSDKSSENALDTAQKNFGIRRIELTRRAIQGETGESFFFQVNDVPIFAAGSCWIPADSFLPRVKPQKYRDWIELAKESNQVMIRVWGGGIYEHDSFYDSCDELGVLVWQDFMFACGMFPAYPEMQESVRIEADQNIRHLRHHPSIVMWCGNNEDYVIPLLRGKKYDVSETDPEKILSSSFPGRYFYEHLLPAICEELVPDVPYWPGSPFGGEMVNSPDVGDIHQWHVWHLEKFPYQDFPRLRGRFVSEFGMQSIPSIQTSRSYFRIDDSLEERDFSTDDYMEWHNKAGSAQQTLTQYCTDNIPCNQFSPLDYIYCTQLVQSEALSTAYRSWRRLWHGPGREICGGALVWQLNDCWPATSWAIADCYLRPKMAYWAVKRENQPLTAGISRVQSGESTTLEIWGSNLTLEVAKVKVQVKAWDVTSGKEVWSFILHEEFQLLKNRSTELGTIDLATAGLDAKKSGDNYRNLVFAVYLLSPYSAAALSQGSDNAKLVYLAHHINFHEPLHEVPLQSTPDGVIFKIVAQAGKIYVQLQASWPMKGALVEAVGDIDIKWDDNGTDLVPGQPTFLGVSGLKVGDENVLKVKWLGGEGGVPYSQ